MLLLATVGI